MSDYRYFGTYAKFFTLSKKESALLMSADNIVGEVYDIEFRTAEGETTAWMVNRWGGDAGFFDAETSRQLSLCRAKGWDLHGILCFVAFTDKPDPGYYWGLTALVCYEPAFRPEFEAFIKTLGNLMAEGLRPSLDLGEQTVNEIIDSKGKWRPTQMLPPQEKDKHTVIMKSRRTFTETMVQKGREKNPGCYVISILFLVAVVAGLVLLICKLFGVL